MIATLLDTVTGKRVVTKHHINSYQWARNNLSCDCKRMDYFDIDMGDGANTCVGRKRFLVVDAKFNENEVIYSLRELNSYYPEILLKKHLPNE